MTRRQGQANAAAGGALPGGKRIGAMAGLLVAAAVLGLSVGVRSDGSLGVAEAAAQSSPSAYGPGGAPLVRHPRRRGGAAGDMYRPSGTAGDMYRPGGTAGDMYRPNGVARGSRMGGRDKAGMGDGSTQARKAGGSLTKRQSGAGVQQKIQERGVR